MPFVYLIHSKTSINANESVYKFGKTTDFYKRLKSYPKGSVPLLVLYVVNCDTFETIVLARLTAQFTQKRDEHGSEYFEGDLGAIINTIMSEYNSAISTQCYSNITHAPLPHTLPELSFVKMESKISAKFKKITPANTRSISTLLCNQPPQGQFCYQLRLILNDFESYASTNYSKRKEFKTLYNYLTCPDNERALQNYSLNIQVMRMYTTNLVQSTDVGDKALVNLIISQFP